MEIIVPIIMLVILYYTVKGAGILYRRAAEAGAGYVLLYFSGWVVLTPVMVLWSMHSVSFGKSDDKKP